MSHEMKYTVRPAAGLNVQREYDEYIKLMEERGLSHAPLRIVTNADGSSTPVKDATCLFDSAEDAQDFAETLGKRTGTSWFVADYPVSD
jgi:hypothetical protein